MAKNFGIGEVISYLDMCTSEGTQLQRGMNFRLRSGRSVVLMSRRSNAPYSDAISPDGKEIIYEGHDATSAEADIPKMVDQPLKTTKGTLTQNGHFYGAAKNAKSKTHAPELIQVYEKLFKGTGYITERLNWLMRIGRATVIVTCLSLY